MWYMSFISLCEAEAGGSLCIQGQSGLHNEFQASQGYIMETQCPNKQTKTSRFLHIDSPPPAEYTTVRETTWLKYTPTPLQEESTQEKAVIILAKEYMSNISFQGAPHLH